MRNRGLIKYKWHISVMTLVLFCLSLVPFPNAAVTVLAEGNSEAADEVVDNVAVLVGNLMSNNDLGNDWAPDNLSGRLNKYKNGIYEGSFDLKAGQYEYKIAMNKSWDESYGNEGQNIVLNLAEDSKVIFRLDYKNKVVYDSVNNPEKFKLEANLVGNIEDLIQGGENWNPANDVELDYVGGGVFEKTFELNQDTMANDYELQYKVAYDNSWSNGEVGDNVVVNIPAGTEKITIVGNYLENYATDSITMASVAQSVSLIGTIRGNENINWDTANTDFEMYQIDKGIFAYSNYIAVGDYEYKGLVNHSWDGGGAPASGNVSLSVAEDRNVTFVVDMNNSTAFDSVNNADQVAKYFGESTSEDLEQPEEPVNPDDVVESPIINADGSVTFRMKYEGETLFLVGSMNGWDNTGIPMTKNDEGIFELTIPLAGGVYEYKYFPVSGSWDNGFIDPNNDLMNNGNSVLNMPGLSIQSANSIEAGATMELTAKIYDTEGNAVGAAPEWTLENEVSGVSLAGNVLSVAQDADSSQKIKVKAVQDGYTAQMEIEILSNMYTYIINYYRPNGDYTDWNLWLWEPNRGGAAYEFNKNDEAEAGFVRAEYKFASEALNFIVRKGAWEEKDTEIDRTIEVQEGNTVEVWIISGDENVYYTRDTANTSAKIKAAMMDSENEIIVTASAEISDEELNTFKLTEIASGDEISVTATRLDTDKVKLTIDRKFFGLIDVNIDVTKQYQVSSANIDAKDVTMRNILSGENYYYDGNDLGLTLSGNNAIFKVWAPTASEVSLMIYDDAGVYDDYGYVKDNKNGQELKMTREDNGVWTAEQGKDLVGKYYLYKVSFANGTVNYAIDPYAKAVSANGQRGYVADLNSTDPSNWNPGYKPELIDFTDAIIYEMHIRDFSIADDSGMSSKGQYSAMTESGTTVAGTDIQSGIDHLKDLGITHVQIQPAYDYASVNEVGSNDQYNWGYDPQNYNVPEGYYSSDATNPTARISEFKEMVQALHDNGIRVVMDVVYNHTNSVGGSPFDAIVPGYYYRTRDNGTYSNGSGCGNEVASERPMVRKFIKDSVKYWAKEYNVDGFRFDLAGLIDTNTMTQITEELRSEVDPSIIIYCEPWQAGGSILSASSQTLKGSQAGNGFGVFNDNIRAAIKGGSDDATQGFATGASDKEALIVSGIEGSINDFTSVPSESINYVTAHDNLNLWDKIVVAAGLEDEANFLTLADGKLTGDSAATYGSVEEAVAAATPYAMITEENVLDNELVKRDLLATAITMTSQGIPFFQAGDEFLRSKYGDHNSYKSPDAINQINWENKVQFKPVFDYYKGLIELRKSHPAFRMSTRAAVESNLVVNKSADNIIVFELKDYANGDSWNNIVVVYNANNSTEAVTLPEAADWNVVVNDKVAGNDVLETLQNTNTVNVAPLSIMVLYDESEVDTQVPTSIEVNSDVIGIEVGGFKFLQPVVRDQFGRIIKDAAIEYEVADENIAKVSGTNGKVTGLAEGQTTITLKYGDAQKKVEVNVGKLEPAEITISGDDSLYETKEIELTAVVKDQYGQRMLNADISWESSNEDIAEVNAFGVVKAKKHGKVTVTAKAGAVEATKKITVNKYTKKYIQFTYVRDDKDYDGWNIWTWQTGLEDGEKDFTTYENGVAVAKFEIAPDTSSVGFVLRKGTDWSEKDPYDSDRYINIDPSMTVTKVTVTSGVGEFFTVPAIENAQIDDGKLIFKYRNDDLYEENSQDTIDKAAVKVKTPSGDTNVYDMSYDDLNEYFHYTLPEIESGVYKYSFIETINGVETESDEYEIEYKALEINIAAESSLAEVDSDENTLIKAKVTGADATAANIRNMYMDLSQIGGSDKVYMDLALLQDGEISQSIGIKDSVTAGSKTIPVIVVDNNGEKHEASATLTVKAKVAVDDMDFSFDEASIYFAVTDRFFNGNESNDDPHGLNYDKSGAMTYHGGDLQGLTDKIPYLSDLGINTLWITPIVENTDFNQLFASGGEQYSYHGYWAKDFTSLDPHLGTLDDLKTLIDTAHENGVKIMVDVVLNHTGYGMKTTDANAAAPNYPTDEDREMFAGMLREVAGSDFTTQEVSGMPDFKTEDPDVRAKIIEWQTDWIEKATTDNGNTIDYFRVDTVKHVDNATLKSFKNKLTEIDPEFKLIGEYYGADLNNTAGQLDNGQMDALLDFGYKDKARDFVNGSLESASSYFDDRASQLDSTNLLGQFLSSHDEDGFLGTVGNDLGKQMVASALQITDKGIPVIYYGEELGATGATANDANRYDMPWDRLDDENYSVVYNHYKRLLNIRDDYQEVFAKGTRNTIAASDEEGYAAFARTLNDDSILVAVNVNGEGISKTLEVPYNAGDELVDLYNNTEYVVSENGTIEVAIPSMADGGTSVIVLKDNNKPDNPDNPDDPDNPENPDNPDNPDNPGTPDDPDNPSNPDNPEQPDNPSDNNGGNSGNNGNTGNGSNNSTTGSDNTVTVKPNGNGSSNSSSIPNTGGTNVIYYVLIAGVIIVAGVVLVKKKTKKAK